ncbi:endolytic transglycosylase MltG [Aristophania vespae]|uniref:endolytic transglycosylase MltG n=1 Tax=Aristophania vespae TaxID=2697033 RepID=UPI0023514D21|nr:endolytic transglycosylase MltG [Aristophania vespae]UMM63266.1 Endolytic murein transglycosylase [Aristophania vespae]
MKPSPSGDKRENISHDLLEPSEGKASWRRFFKAKYGVFLFFLLVLSTVIAGYGHYTDPGPLQETKNVVIPHGGMKSVINTLQKENIISPGRISSLFFQIIVRLTSKEGPIQAAEFSFPKRVSIAHSLAILRHGKAIKHSITIAEGLTAAQIRAILQNDELLDGEVQPFREGSVLPQTFYYLKNTQRSALLQRMQRLMDITLDKIWNERDKIALEGLVHSPQELVTLASIIERETSLPEERPRVARVFLNRLKKNMKLQTDPTVIYALNQGKEGLDHSLTRRDLQFQSPYNTYQVAGLPPGPICSPGVASLQAAAHPANGDELYFVATGQGGHYFAKTLKEHIHYIKAYRKALISSH